MKILYLAGFRHSFSTEAYVAHAMTEKGHEVKQLRDARATLSGAKWHCRTWKPDIVLFAKTAKPWTVDLIEWCRSRRIKTVCWQWDLFFGYARKPLPQFACDYVFTTDGGHPDSWTDRGYNHAVIRQGIHEPEHVIYQSDYRHDVGFVGRSGRHSRDRLRLLKHLNVHHNAIHFENVRGLALNRALAECKIIVGDSVNVKNYWSNRVYEITGRGGFILHPKTVGLDAEFVDGEHIATYERNDMADLDSKIRYYLVNEDERERIRRAGWRHCGRHYTYGHRVGTLLSAVSCAPPVYERLILDAIAMAESNCNGAAE